MRGRLAQLTVESEGQVLVARLEGEIDSSNADEIRLELTEQVPNTADALVLDLTATSYMDSSGVQLLFELAARLRTRRQSLRLVVPDNAPMGKVLELCDVASVVPIHPELEAAIASLND